MAEAPVDPDFETRYRSDPDPFGVHERWYERRKLACLEAVLGRERYAFAWDAACGVGQVAAALARRCDRVLATDESTRAVELTAGLLAHEPDVHVGVHRLPYVPEPAHDADLVVLAEVLYYLPDDDRAALARRVATGNAQEVVAVSWRHRAADTWLSGSDSVAELGHTLLRHDWEERTCLLDPDFEIRTWTRP